MPNKINPSLIANTQKELDEIFNKVKSYSNVFHVDVMDGKFVKNKSLLFDFKLPKGKFEYQTHLMVKNPREWIRKNSNKAFSITFHIESCKDKEVEETIKLIKSKKKKVGIAINPKTNVKKIAPHLKSIDLVLVMTVTPGKYGSKFIPSTIKKVKEIRKLNPKMKIGIDGGINDKTIKKVSKLKLDFIVSGSYLQKSKNIKNAFKVLKGS
jgi:ribulose-phosphate 3-epimerase|tara:strand:- start:464 stop:1093 length:630 start_codon:yes stop_codon:yes gene_type:complete